MLRGLRPRLVATFALVAAFTSAALAITSYVLVRDAVLDRATDVALREARVVLTELVVSLPPDASASDARAFVERQPGLGAAGAVAIAPDGTSDTTSVSLSAGSVPPELLSASASGRLVWLRTGSERRDHVIVGAKVGEGPAVFLFFPLSEEVGEVELLRNVLAGAGSTFVLLSALVGYLATRGLLRPLRGARVAAHRMEVGLLGTRLPEEGRDEFTDLARAFNRMADALERTVGDLRTLEASQRRFVSDVFHELRTPLTALNTAADVLDANNEGLNEPGRRAARLLVVESRRLASMVEDLMEISRFDARAAGMAWEPVDLGQLVRGALELRGWTDRVAVEDAGDGAVNTYADPRRLDAVVGNLVGNALEHGGPPVRVTLGATGAEVSLTVTDAGPGIPPEHLDHVFERFYKADPSRSRGGGSGLGLAIARENARLHGGDITVRSEPGRGTTFTCRVPRRSSAPEGGGGAGVGAEVAPPPVAEPLPAGDGTVTTSRHPAIRFKPRSR
ncbi:MAG: HAMP domain-containing histidine kinase [Actinomycetota bacterium]|nr:HAMP domain-containing histidine kinase [Actinomycetota bacterium]